MICSVGVGGFRPKIGRFFVDDFAPGKYVPILAAVGQDRGLRGMPGIAGKSVRPLDLRQGGVAADGARLRLHGHTVLRCREFPRDGHHRLG